MFSYDGLVAQTQHSAQMLSALSRPIDFPCQHFALIYINQDGQIGLETSPSIENSGAMIFTSDVRERFMRTAAARTPAASSFTGTSGSMQTGENEAHRPMLNPGAHSQHLIPCDWQIHQNKRQRRNGKQRDQPQYHSDVGYDHLPVSDGPRRTAIRISDESRMKGYYEKAFEAFQQINCRAIAKAFIKLVEPRKQVNYPYNGRRAGSGSSPDQPLDPEMTKPPWWPAGVTHKEPDHLLKAERIRLLIYILRELGQSHGTTAEKIREAGLDVRRQVVPPERLTVLDEIYYVRNMEERYLNGEISGDTTIYVIHVHLTDSDYDTDREHDMQQSSLAITGSPADESKWMRDVESPDGEYGKEAPPDSARTVSSVSVSPTTTTLAEPQPLVYSHDAVHMLGERLPQSQDLGLHMSQSSGSVTSRSNSFDGSMSYSSQELDANIQPAIFPQHVASVHHLERLHNHERPSLPQYLSQPTLLSVPTPPASVMWSTPVYQQF